MTTIGDSMRSLIRIFNQHAGDDKLLSKAELRNMMNKGKLKNQYLSPVEILLYTRYVNTRYIFTRYVNTRYIFTRYVFTRYIFTRYVFTRYVFTRYIFTRYVFTRYIFTRYVFTR